MSEDLSAIRGAAPVSLGIDGPSASKPLFYARGDCIFRRPEQTGPGTYSLGGPIAEADNPVAAAEIARRLNAHDELLAALREVRTAIEKADPAVLVCTLWMPGAAAETVVDRIDAALAAAEGRADG